MIIPLSKENNLIYLFITHTPDGEIKVLLLLNHVYLKVGATDTSQGAWVLTNSINHRLIIF